MTKDEKLIRYLNKDFRIIKKAGGQTNRNYIIGDIKDKKKYFVRFPWERPDIVDRKIEAKNILALLNCRETIGILPHHFVYVLGQKNILNPKEKYGLPDGAMVSEYIKGKDIGGMELEKEEVRESLIKSLHLFHTSKIKFVNKYDVFRDEIQKYKKKAKRFQIEKLVSSKRLKEIEKIEREAKENFPLGGEVSTHNDLIFENLRLMKDGRVYLLDFEYAGLNIRQGIYYDLGIILGGNLFQKNPIKIETFEKILKKADGIYKKELDRKKIYFGALINVLVMFWWGIVKYFSPETKEEKKYFYIKREYVLKREKGINFVYNFIKKIK